LAFLLPLLDKIDVNSKKVQAIILAPSRELVVQIESVGEKLFKDTGIRIASIIGGANVRGQIKRLRDDKPQVIVATPGRLAELVFGLEKLKLGMVSCIIIDEVDNLLREPYSGEIQTIIEATNVFKKVSDKFENIQESQPDVALDSDSIDGPGSNINKSDENNVSVGENLIERTLNKRLVCFASATGNDPNVISFIDNLYGSSSSRESMKYWSKVTTDSYHALPSSIAHGLISVPRIKALDTLRRLIRSKPDVKSALIFVNDPHRVEIVCDKLLEMGLIAAPLHGETSKEDRKEILSRIRDGRLSLVVTTELAARGIDIPDLTHVINFELPTDSQHYVHRAGRCGRAGRKGLVINFATPDTKFVIRRFGKQLGIKIRDCELREAHVHLKLK